MRYMRERIYVVDHAPKIHLTLGTWTPKTLCSPAAKLTKGLKRTFRLTRATVKVVEGITHSPFDSW